MGDLNALGSEKLQGMDKIRRIMEIARYNETPKQEINELSTTNYTITLADGKTYGIVKERLGYIIKSGLNESTLDYNDPIKHRKHFRSYSEAMKKLNLMAGELNRVNGNEFEIPLIGEQAGQKKKFILKLPKKTDTKTPDVGGSSPTPPPTMSEPTTPAPAPTTEPTPPSSPDMGMEPMGGSDMGGSTTPTTPEMGSIPVGEPTTTDMGGEPIGEPTTSDTGGEPTSPDMGEPSGDDFDLEGGENGETKQPSLKSIQRLTGKLSQRLRSIEKENGLESDDIKYVLNSIISALNLDNLEEDDRDDILSKFDEEDEYGTEGPGDLDMGSEDDFDMGGEPEMPEPMGSMTSEPKETFDQFNESVVENVLSKYFKIDPSEKVMLEQKKKKEFIKKQLQTAEIKREIRKLCETVEQMESAYKLLNENGKFIGKTNKENLIFSLNGKQIKVTTRGRIL
jgi:hypothetical protein